MRTCHKIIIGDSRRMGEIQDESVHLVVTSPPYWQLKDYGGGLNQIGFDDSYEDYINNLSLVWHESKRVLLSGCRLCINIGDQFARSAHYGRYKVIPIRTEIIKFCESDGFDYMGAIIWQKITTTNTTGGGNVMGSYPFPRNGILKLDYEFILLFKKPGKAPNVSKKAKETSKLSLQEWNCYFAGHWKFAGVKQEKHLAAFPEELPLRLIRMFSCVGDTVLDPFLGSGTTSLVAKKLGRNSVGYEINRKYLSLIKEKFGTENRKNDYRIIIQKKSNFDFKKAKSCLPYVFSDPLDFKRKTDPRKFNYGSKVNGKPSHAKEKYYSVKKVLSPVELMLNDGTKIRLIGLKKKPRTIKKAVNYLLDKTRRNKVFLKFDKLRYDENGNLFCYLYLSNKTFINSHLLKNGWAEVDSSIDFKYREKFIKIWQEAAQNSS